MDHYEVCKFRGRHHHILTCMLAHFFFWHPKIRLGKKAPSITPGYPAAEAETCGRKIDMYIQIG